MYQDGIIEYFFEESVFRFRALPRNQVPLLNFLAGHNGLTAPESATLKRTIMS